MANILQWNIRGYQSNFEELKSAIRKFQGPSCICLQETFHGVQVPFAPSQYTMVPGTAIAPPASGVRPSRGLITLVNRETPFYVLDINTELEVLAIRINIGKEFTVCNIYISPTENVSTQQIRLLIDQLPTPFILLGDFNARSELWGEPLTNSRGRLIEDILATTDLSLLNDGSPTHYHV